jgi:ribose transport system substrate-binding protein
MQGKRSIRTALAAALLAVVAALAVAACGSSKSKSESTAAESKAPVTAATTSSEAKSEGSTSQTALVEESKKAMEELAEGKGVETGPPPGPAAVKGKNVWAIACGLNAPGCSVPAEAVKEANKYLGWKLTIGDGKLTPAGETEALKSAIAAKAEGLILIGFDCVSAKSAIEEADARKIPIVQGLGSDCNEWPKEGGKPLILKQLAYVQSKNSLALYRRLGLLHAEWTVAHTNGKAKIIALRFDVFSENDALDKEYEKYIKKCTGCTVLAERNLPASALANPEMSQIVETLLQKYPEANVLETPNDSEIDLIGQALKKANRPNLMVIANEGYPATFSLIREGLVATAIIEPQKAYYWGTADILNRLFAGEKPSEIKPEGYETGLVEKNVKLPAPGAEYEPKINFREKFAAIWEGKNK